MSDLLPIKRPSFGAAAGIRRYFDGNPATGLKTRPAGRGLIGPEPVSGEECLVRAGLALGSNEVEMNMAERQCRDRGGLRVMLALAVVLPVVACSGSNDQWANSINSYEVGEDRYSAAPGCDTTQLEQMTEACNDEINRHHNGHH